MARSVADIQNQITTVLTANLLSVGITVDPTKWSKRNILRVLCFAFATCCATLEQLMDTLKLSLETTASQSSAASPAWIQAKMFQFQYSATNPQVIQLINTVPQYPVVDTTLRIISACSVTSTIANQVKIKVATGNPFVALNSSQIASAQGYINEIGVTGIIYSIISLNPDKIYINADIYYQGQYASVIQSTMIAAIVNWFSLIAVNNFNGDVEMSDLEGIMKAVPGVNDVVLKNVIARQDTDPFSAGTYLILNSQVIQRKWVTIAGYIAQETTSGETFSDSLNFIVE
ncbi:MAG TPA: hypothetical protein VN722_08465 [Hanamia sp.]|nr:hypothetical protein [Hanamia sp.]